MLFEVAEPINISPRAAIAIALKPFIVVSFVVRLFAAALSHRIRGRWDILL